MEASLLANDTYVPPSLGGERKGEGDFVGTGFETNSDELAAHQASLRAQQPTTALGKLWCRIRDSLTIQTMLGMSFGFAGGLIVRAAYHNDVPDRAVEIMGYPGEIFMNALTMTVVPLIAVGMVCAVNNLDEFAKLKTMGIRAMKYYLLTTFVAASIGIACVNIFKPGKGQAITNKSKVEQLDSLHKKETMDAFLDVGRSMTLASKGDQGNLINGLLTFNILGVIVFFLMFGVFLAKLGERGKQVANMFSVINDTLMGMVNLFIVFTPFGICSLVMSEVAKQDNLWGILGDLAMFTVTCVVGTIMQVVLVYCVIYFVCTRENPFAFLKRCSAPIMTAFATSSSAVALPVTIKTLEGIGLDTDVVRFILPLGATINMDGTAVYFPVAVIFMANMLEHSLTFGEQIQIAIVSSFVSMGAAPIPSAGLVYLVLIMQSANIPAGGELTFVLAIDWLLDRVQTCCNVCGDCVGAAILSHYKRRDDLSKAQ